MSSTGAWSGAWSVVIIEDDPDVRALLATVLAGSGAEVTAAATGHDGIEAVRREDPDVVTVDLGRSTPPDGGAITVTLTERGLNASLSIADNAVGIPEAELPRQFERLFRASTAADTGAHGTGLGLAIVKSLVELNGGTVAVTSTAGSGSVFTIELPLAAGRGVVAARRT